MMNTLFRSNLKSPLSGRDFNKRVYVGARKCVGCLKIRGCTSPGITKQNGFICFGHDLALDGDFENTNYFGADITGGLGWERAGRPL